MRTDAGVLPTNKLTQHLFAFSVCQVCTAKALRFGFSAQPVCTRFGSLSLDTSFILRQTHYDMWLAAMPHCKLANYQAQLCHILPQCVSHHAAAREPVPNLPREASFSSVHLSREPSAVSVAKISREPSAVSVAKISREPSAISVASLRKQISAQWEPVAGELSRHSAVNRLILRPDPHHIHSYHHAIPLPMLPSVMSTDDKRQWVASELEWPGEICAG